LLFVDFDSSDGVAADRYLNKACENECHMAIFVRAFRQTQTRGEHDLIDAKNSLEKLIEEDFCPAIAFMIEVYLGNKRIQGMIPDNNMAYQLMNKILSVPEYKIDQKDIVSRISYPYNGEDGFLRESYNNLEWPNFNYPESSKNISTVICKELLDGEESKISKKHALTIFMTQLSIIKNFYAEPNNYYFMGRFFEKGIICLQNYFTAYAFYSYAAVYGHLSSADKRDTISSYLDQGQRVMSTKLLGKYIHLRRAGFFRQTRMRRVEKLFGIRNTVRREWEIT
jgi:hypothetical protein